MKILLITGKLAEPLVRHAAQTAPPTYTCKVLVLPVAVAAFLHPKFVASRLRNRALGKHDLILLPGMTSGDTTLVKDATGIPAFKGPRHAVDLPFILRAIDRNLSLLSTTEPADHILQEHLQARATSDLITAETSPLPHPPPPRTLRIGSGRRTLMSGSTYPIRVIAEITDAPIRSDEELIHKARRFAASGATVIDVGMIANAPDSKAARHTVQVVRQAVQVPISIDSSDPKEIAAGIKAGASLVLSLDQSNMAKIPKSLRSRAAFVLVPATQAGQQLPSNTDERLQLMEANLRTAHELGYTHLIADLLCDSLITPGLTPAIHAYARFTDRHPTIPLLMGIGNVTELLDADSPGVNAVLAGIASELGVTFMLTAEVSDKTRGSVWELHRAAQMMFLTRSRQSSPKDLGLDLLLLKTKRFTEIPYQPADDEVITEATPGESPPVLLDPSGFLTFHIDRQQQRLIARHYPTPKAKTPDIILAARTARQLLAVIIEHGLISRLDHAGYVGSELVKAEIALKIGRPYTQGQPLFTSSYPCK
ncbi:MAG: dihydropteroate synthase-like protein [Promethearchaeota archaeon]